MNTYLNVRSYPERIAGWIPIPSWISWTVFWSAILITDVLLSGNAGQAHSHLTELGVVLFCLSICISLIMTSRLMIRLAGDLSLFINVSEAELSQWYERQLKLIYSGPWPLVAGIVMALLVEVLVGPSINVYNQFDSSVLIFRTLYRIAGFVLLGISIWSVIQFMLLPSRMLHFKLKTQLTNLQGLGLHAIGNIFFRIAFMGAISFATIIFTILVSPLSQDNSVFVLAILGAVLIFLLFLVPQLGIHRIMAAEKRQQLLAFSAHLNAALTTSLQTPTTENVQKVKELFELQKHLQEVNDWPFDTKTLWQLISALLIPLLLVLIQLAFKV